MTLTLCTRCHRYPRALNQRWCHACRAAWMQVYRLKKKAAAHLTATRRLVPDPPPSLYARFRRYLRLFLP